MITDEEIESFLYQLELPFDSVGDGMWIIHNEADNIDNIVVIHDYPVLTVRVKVMQVPEENREALFETLLRLNATDMVAGAYGIEDDGSIVIIDSIQTPNLDLNEIQGSIDAVSLALTTHFELLSKFRS